MWIRKGEPFQGRLFFLNVVVLPVDHLNSTVAEDKLRIQN